MNQTASMIRVLASHATHFSDTEPLIGAMLATLPRGDKTLDPVRMAEASGFPLASKMALAMTPIRIVVYKTGWGDKVGAYLGEIPQRRVTGVEITWNRKLAVVAFALSDAPIVAMITNDTDGAEHFRNQFLKLRGRI